MTPDTTQLPVALTHIPGLDTQRGLLYLNGRVASYLSYLGRFATGHGDDIRRLREHLHSGPSPDAQRLAHNLKSSSASLGMGEMQRLAAALEAAIAKHAAPAEIEARIIPLEDELHRLCSAILTSLPATPAEPTTVAVDWQQVGQILRELEPLLSSGNMQANRMIETHRKLLHSALGPIAVALAKCTEDFHYQEAMPVLRQALAEAAIHE
jgi:two-component system sensor histidine kinase/response regulator